MRDKNVKIKCSEFMARTLKLFFLLIVLAIVFSGCLSAGPAQDMELSFSHIEDKEWLLMEVRRGSESIVMDREQLEAVNLGGVYTIRFENGRFSGVGASNRYFGPYTPGNDGSISIGDIASTMMFSFIQPEGLAEAEYFSLLSEVSRWDFRDEKLELFANNSGPGAVLIFALNQ